MQGSKSNFFTKSNKPKAFDDDAFYRQKNVGGKFREKMEKNKQARRTANKQFQSMA